MKRAYLLLVACLVGGVACDVGAPLRVVDEPRDVLSIEIAPAVQNADSGATVTFSARVVGRGGRTLTEYRPAWGIGDPTIAALDGPGSVRALRRGTSEVIVRAGGRVGVATVVVR